jgi:hypothetical protein
VSVNLKISGAIDPWFWIFKILPCDYFIACSLHKMTYNSARSLELKNLKPRTSGDTASKKILPLQLSIKSNTELKIGVADFGSVLNYFSFPF